MYVRAAAASFQKIYINNKIRYESKEMIQIEGKKEKCEKGTTSPN